MRTICLVVVMIGMSTAAMQRASPVYQPQVTATGPSSTGIATPYKPITAATSPITQAPVATSPPQPQQVAQARESLASDTTMMQPQGVNPSTPSQNYYVYYYPHANGASPNTVGQPNSSGIWSLNGWTDVAAGVGSAAAVLIGFGVLYNQLYQYGPAVSKRALRELKDLSTEDATRMARGVLRALEKFSSINERS